MISGAVIVAMIWGPLNLLSFSVAMCVVVTFVIVFRYCVAFVIGFCYCVLLLLLSADLDMHVP